jgi:hypothetical protein
MMAGLQPVVAICTTGCAWRKRYLETHRTFSPQALSVPSTNKDLTCQSATLEIARKKHEIAATTPNPVAMVRSNLSTSRIDLRRRNSSRLDRAD